MMCIASLIMMITIKQKLKWEVIRKSSPNLVQRKTGGLFLDKDDSNF